MTLNLFKGPLGALSWGAPAPQTSRWVAAGLQTPRFIQKDPDDPYTAYKIYRPPVPVFGEKQNSIGRQSTAAESSAELSRS